MKLGIFLQHYFPFGGLQLDAARLARAAEDSTLVVSTAEEPPSDINLLKLNSGGFTNHTMLRRFGHDCRQLTQFDQTIAFSRVPETPFHFCGDPCLRAKIQGSKNSLTQSLPRYRHLLEIENALFGLESQTHLFFLSEAGPSEFIEQYQLTKDRYTVLPPWVDRPKDISQTDLRAEFNIPDQTPILLFVGSNFTHKRLHLAIDAVTKTKAHLIVCGNDSLKPFQSHPQIHFAGARDDVSHLMRGANALILPSIHETAGMVLTEALVHHLPVICTESCGYAPHVSEAGNIVLPENPQVSEIVDALSEIFTHENRYREAAANWANDDTRYQTASLMLSKMARP